MSAAVSDALAELIAMRAAGEITPEEFTAARDRLRREAPTEKADASVSALSPRTGPREEIHRPMGTSAGPTSVAAPATTKRPRRLGKALLGISAFIVGMMVLGHFFASKTYRRADYGDAWPYPGFDSATVRCEVKKFGSTDRPIATVELGGVVYGLNGAALDVGGYPSPEPLEAADRSAFARTTQQMINEALADICHVRQGR